MPPVVKNRPPLKMASEARRIERIERLAHLLDEAFRVPGTNYRVGWDSIIGLIPGVGDAATAAVSAYIIYEARKAGVPKWVLGRMVANVGLDFVVGAVPLVGDFFDAAFKANRRNTQLLKRHLEKPL